MSENQNIRRTLTFRRSNSDAMWSPTHVQVTVQRAKELQSHKGTNGVFVTIGLGKEKYQTSIKDKEGDRVEWHEKCELQIPKHGNTASIVLNVLSQNFLGVDQFLGCVNVPLNELDVYERPKNKWYELRDKNGKDRTKERGELEIKIGFNVKPGGSLNDVSKKDGRRASLGQLSHVAHNVGGSLASIGSVDKKSFKKLAKSITRKMKKEKKTNGNNNNNNNNNDNRNDSSDISVDDRIIINHANNHNIRGQAAGDADPGVISDDEFALDDLSHTGSGCSLEMMAASTITNPSSVNGSIETVASSENPAINTAKDYYHHHHHTTLTYNTMPPLKPPRSVTPIHEKYVQRWEQKLLEAKKTRAILNKSSERIVVGGEAKITPTSPGGIGKLSNDIVNQYADKSREDLIETIQTLKEKLNRMNKEKKEMEDYIDNLLLKVIDSAPHILQNPYNNQ